MSECEVEESEVSEERPFSLDDAFDKKTIEQWTPLSEMTSALPSTKMAEDVWKKFPKVCVIGMQTTGKSSLLEMIVGLECLPKGQNMQTSRPNNINIIKDADCVDPTFEIYDGLTNERSKTSSTEEFKRTILKLN